MEAENNEDETGEHCRSKDQFKDNAYSWWIMVCAFVSNIVVTSEDIGVGLYMIEWSDMFLVPMASLGWIGSINAFTSFGACVFAGPIIDKYGGQVVWICGTLLVMIGFVWSSFATYVGVLYVSYGVLSGFGHGLQCLVPLVILPQYFKRRQNFASGLSLMGMSVGSFTVVYLLHIWIKRYTWRGALMIHAGIVVHLLLLTVYYVPYETRYNIKSKDQKGDSKEKLNRELESQEGLNGKHNSQKGLDWKRDSQELLNRKRDSQEGLNRTYRDPQEAPQEGVNQKQSSQERLDDIESSKSNTIRKLLKEYIKSYKLSIFKDICFILAVIHTCTVMVGLEVAYVVSPSRAVHLGFSKDEAAYMPFALSLASFFARLFASILSDFSCVNVLVLNIIGTLAGGIVLVLSTFLNRFIPIVLITAIFGISTGTVSTTRVTTNIKLFGQTRLGMVEAWLSAFRGVTLLATLPAVGFTYDITGNFKLAFLLAGFLQIFGGIMLSLATYIHSRRSRGVMKQCENDPSNKELSQSTAEKLLKPKDHS